ncbi:MAG: YbjN domain-containing protein [Proteobacteria bacterium]|nr:YbjN domain-containing protein [Pseudomonadota bacterium]
MAYAVVQALDPVANPLDAVERIVLANGWMFERQGDDEIVAEVQGRVSVYRMWFAWRPDIEALQFGSGFDVKVGRARRAAVFELLAMVNAAMWLGHFELCSDDGLVAFRHTMLLRGGCGATPEQIVDLIGESLEASERYYPAFHFVVWGGMAPAKAMAASMMETMGEA